ncbi:MAG TPA: T9SS type A sorting domain-containing protein [Candidatus Didemnitutus sp.]|nr:T9SS type A sorting domain-containing protein [Candidatus Didemnitutus sp.]
MRPVQFIIVLLASTVVTAQTLVPVESLGRRGVFAQGRFFLQTSGSVVIYDTTLRSATRESLPEASKDSSEIRRFAHELYPKTVEWTSVTTPLVEGRIMRVVVDKRDALWMFNEKGDVSIFDGIEWATIHLCPHHNSKRRSCISDVTLVDNYVRVASCSSLIDIDVALKTPLLRMPIPSTLVRTTFLDDERFAITSTGVHLEVDMKAKAVLYHDELATLGEGSDTSDQWMKEWLVDQRSLKPQIDQWLSQREEWTIHVLSPCDTLTKDRYINHSDCVVGEPHFDATIRAMLNLEAIESLDYRIMCGNSYFGLDYIYDVTADIKEHVYLATERGVIVLPNPSPVKVDEEASLTKLNVYPNPATSSLTVELPSTLPPDATLLVLNATGTTMMQLPIHDSGSMQINVSGLATGSYLVQIRTMNEVRTAGFVVKR